MKIFLFWIYLTASTMLFVSGGFYIRQFGVSGSLVTAFGATGALVAANLLYSKALAQHFLTASIFSAASSLLGMMLLGVLVFGARITPLHACAAAFAVAAAIMVAFADGAAA